MVTLSELAQGVQSNVAVIDKYLKEHNLPQPTFDSDSPTELPLDADVQRARMLLIEQASTLANLATGAADHLRWHCMNDKYDDTALHFLAAFNVFDAVPREGSISYVELADKVGVPEHRLSRILAQAYTQHYFYPPKPGYVAHTSNSAMAIGDTLARAWILHNFEEVQPWYANKLVDATRKWGDSYNPLHTGPNVNAAPGEEKSFYQIMDGDENGEWNGVKGQGFRLRRLYDTDKFFGTGGAIKGTNMLRAYDWAKLGKATIVNIDGITGHLATTVALAFPDLTFIIQQRKSPWYEKQFYDNLPAELKGRVEYMAHDQYDEQPVKGADLYFMSTVLHKENEEKAIKILRRCVEAMDPKKSRILTRDIVMDGGDPPPEDAIVNGKTISKEKGVYDAGLGPTGVITRLNIGVDLQMLTVLNSYERTRAEWIALFRKADSRFVLKQCIQTVGNCASLMEWALEE